MLETKTEITVGQTVFVSRSIEYWDKPYTMKRHHVYDIKSVILRVRIDNIKDREFIATLIDNNFEKDGESFVFNINELLSNQNFNDFDKLGKWKFQK